MSAAADMWYGDRLWCWCELWLVGNTTSAGPLIPTRDNTLVSLGLSVLLLNK